ncbi:MAG: hypothetical protein ASARMPRED_002686 [Alectoria sarmentosa]|nr:MAG: hypothetical protein ASARMPRED_002686 [Alectoria sarmentosa]
MPPLVLVALLAAKIFASPLRDSGQILEPRHAPPGFPQTNVTLGDVTNLWGCGTDPEAIFTAQLQALCPDSRSCISNQPNMASVKYVSPDDTMPNQETRAITPQGAYPAGMAGPIIQAIETATKASGVLTWQTIDYGTKNGPITHETGLSLSRQTCQVATFPAFIGVEYCDSPDHCGNIQLSIKVTKPVDGFCVGTGQAASLGSSMSATFGPVGEILSSTFGIISAICHLEMN